MRDSATRCLLVLPLLAALTLAADGCSGSSGSSSTIVPSATATSSTETFTGSVDQNGSTVHSFTVKSGGYTLLVGYTALSPTSVSALGVGIAAWDAASSTCGLNLTQNDAAKAGSTALTGTANAGNYCVRVYDGGNLAGGVTASYTLQVQHY